jgi:hypothetical protein
MRTSSCLWWVALALVCGCKKPTSQDVTNGSATAGSAAAPAPTWKATSHPIELSCGDSPLALPVPQAAPAVPERPLAHADALAQCHDQASVDAACDCLAKSVATWGTKLLLAGPATCTPQPDPQPDAVVVQIQDNPVEPDSKTGGTALVLVAKRGTTWSALAVVDAEGDIDLAQTPKLTESVKLLAFEPHPIAGGSLYSIETRGETRESDMGDHDIEGGVVESLCTTAFCYAPLRLADWSYTWTPAKTSCAVSKLASFVATFEPSSVTMVLEHGSDRDGVAGRYRL